MALVANVLAATGKPEAVSAAEVASRVKSSSGLPGIELTMSPPPDCAPLSAFAMTGTVTNQRWLIALPIPGAKVA